MARLTALKLPNGELFYEHVKEHSEVPLNVVRSRYYRCGWPLEDAMHAPVGTTQRQILESRLQAAQTPNRRRNTMDEPHCNLGSNSVYALADKDLTRHEKHTISPTPKGETS